MTGGKEDADQSSVLRFTEVFGCVGINPQRYQDTSLPQKPGVVWHWDPQGPCSDLALWSKRCWYVKMVQMPLIQMPQRVREPEHGRFSEQTCRHFDTSHSSGCAHPGAHRLRDWNHEISFTSGLGSVPSTAQLCITAFRKILSKVTSGFRHPDRSALVKQPCYENPGRAELLQQRREGGSCLITCTSTGCKRLPFNTISV